jgi:Calcineurin-like phosphoesterase.
MSENSRLKTAASSRYSEEEVLFEEEEFELSKKAKYWLYVTGGLLLVGSLYFFTIFLPAMFIPESVELEGISKLSELGVTLIPLAPERVQQLGMPDQAVIKELGEVELGGDEADLSDESTNASNLQKSKVERLIMIGDIHGHYKEFLKLLKKINFNRKSDHLLVLGDFITKGPDSFKVLDFLVENDIDCIMGNHEYYVLQNYAQYHGKKSPYFRINSTETSETNQRFTAKDNFNQDPEFLLAKKLNKVHVKYINQCSIIKKLGLVPLHKSKNSGTSKFAEGIAVHAGIRWDLELLEQNPVENLEMRSYIGPFYNETTDDPFEENALSWSKYYNKKQKEMNPDDGLVVYYGHDARRGLSFRRFAKGMDSGCEKGDQLTAMVIWNEVGTSKKGKKVVLHKEVPIQVDC